MLKKILIIVLLSLGLILLLVLKPWQKEINADPRIIDRLPEADFIGTIDLLELSKDIVEVPAYKNLIGSQFMGYDFFLRESRSFGLNIQQPIYFFFNDDKTGGFIVKIDDADKVFKSVEQYKNQFNFKKIKNKSRNTYRSENPKIYLTFDDNLMLIHFGEIKPEVESKIFNSRINEISPQWKEFMNFKKNGPISIQSKWGKLNNYGFKKIQANCFFDTQNISIDIDLYKEFPFHIKLKEGQSLKADGKQNYLDLNLDITEFKNHTNDILYQELEKISNKYGLPFLDFLNIWNGELSLRNDGDVRIEEKYYETSVDEEFNTILEEKTKVKFVPNITVYISVNEMFSYFMKKIRKKGIVVKESNSEKIRFLMSPPLTMNKTKDSIFLQSGNLSKELTKGSSNRLSWSFKETPLKIEILDLEDYVAHGKIILKIDDLVKSPIFKNEKPLN